MKQVLVAFGLVALVGGCGNVAEEQDGGDLTVPPAQDLTAMGQDADAPVDAPDARGDLGFCAGLPDGTPCNDGDACSPIDTCQAGACVGAMPVVCKALDPCHLPGVCDPMTGVCSNPNQPDGTGCSDGDGCSQIDTCEAGACVGAMPVVCTALDPCHLAGVCDPTTGACSNPSQPDGTACSDGDVCSQSDTCQAGTCVGAMRVVCAALDQCHDAGACDPMTGVCSDPDKLDGTACSDGDACSEADACQAGTCVGMPVVCAALDQCHDAGACDPMTGVCSNPDKLDGAACSDGDACTRTDTCQAGACVGADPVVCVALDQCHDAGVCDPMSGACSDPDTTNGTLCSDGDACTRIDNCVGGVCVGAMPVVCAALDQCHDAGVCDPMSGACSDPDKANGSACSDGDACTRIDNCVGGACVGAMPVVCAALDQCHDAGVCDSMSGACYNPDRTDGTLCSDGNACTQTDTCLGGTCTGANPVVCTALDQCHDAGTCNPATAVCSNPNKVNGTACNPGNPCLGPGTCLAGTCTGTAVADGTSCVVGGNTFRCITGACTCGNGTLDANEGCDDANATVCDGCNTRCQDEAAMTYTAGPGLSAAITDDSYRGNLASMRCVNVTVPSAGDGKVDYVCATVGMSHTSVGDLTLKLISPANTTVTLMSRPGVVEAADDGTGVGGDTSNLNLAFPITFVDGGPKSAENLGNTITNTQIVCRDDAACTYDPNNGAAPAGKLAAFIGQAGAGSWLLCAGDGAFGELGSVDQVKLIIGQ